MTNFDENPTQEQKEENLRLWKIQVTPIVTALQIMFYVTVIMLAIKLLFKA